MPTKPVDIFYGRKEFIGPYTDGFAITPSDSTDLPHVTRAIYVGGAGPISILFRDNPTPVTFAAVPVGTVLMVRAARVRATGTTATNLIGLY